jgi:hypothetical protein
MKKISGHKFFGAMVAEFSNSMLDESVDGHALRQVLDSIEATDATDCARQVRQQVKALAAEIDVKPDTMRRLINRKGFRQMLPQVLCHHLRDGHHNSEAAAEFIERHGQTPNAIIGQVETEQAPETTPADLETDQQRLDFYQRKLAEASNVNDTRNIKIYGELLLKTSESIRRNEIHAQKVGLKSGDTITREKCELYLRQAFYGGNAAVNAQLTMICEHVAGMKTPDEVYNCLKPAFVGGRIFSGFDRLRALDVPQWFLDCVKDSAKDFLGNSEVLWTDKEKAEKDQ